VAPVWFDLDEGDLIFRTIANSVKSKNLHANRQVAISEDEERFPFAFVLGEGTAKLRAPSPRELLPCAKRIAGRSTGDDRAESYGQRNATEVEVMIRARLVKVVARRGVAS
jgi:hypothetical protein